MEKSLQEILKGVSRSFYLSVQLCPRKMREAVGLGFLFCKLADTIADTEALSVEQRLNALHDFRKRFVNKALTPPFHFELAHGGSAAERALFTHYQEIVRAFAKLSDADQEVLYWLVPTLTQGMITDLTYFQDQTSLKALPDELNHELYLFHVAGCVGVFWTRLIRNHFAWAKNWPEEVEQLGERLGKGLQLVNILRDLPRDLQLGRCYLPETALQEFGLTVQDLQNPEALKKCRPLLQHYTEKAENYLQVGENYKTLLPFYARRMRASVALPMLIGFETLKLLRASDDWLKINKTIKIKRSKVYALLFRALFFS